MITELEVDGFKSLQDFQVSFHRGLNVLIGSNGAGKTNVCQALGLIASVADGRLLDYILSLGGTASIFTIYPSSPQKDQNTKKLFISCFGETTGTYKQKRLALKYKYSFGLILSEESVIIHQESLRIRRLSSKKRFKTILTAERQKDGNLLKFNICDTELIGPAQLNLKSTGSQSFAFDITGESLSGYIYILSTLIYACYLVLKDLRFSRAWNIDPHLAKRPTDFLEYPNMLSDGRGLPNALHELISTSDNRIDDLKLLLKRILPRYKDIHPVSFETMMRSFSIINSDDIDCPAHSISDGTIKLIALLVGIFSQQSNTSIIEEPENYLHPWACQSLIEYLRDYFTNSVCLLTTHSETVLNLIAPKEIIIVENQTGKTKAFRLSNKKDLQKAISVSGFGCGYHYLAGNIGGTP